MKRRSYALVGALFCFVANSAWGDAKQSFLTGDLSVFNGSQSGFTTVLSKHVRTASQKELLLGVALECGLFTRTKVSSKSGISDQSSASASVEVRVLVDGREAKPGKVVFCRRTQELTATFGGILNECRDSNGDGVISNTECTWDPEELDLVIDSMSANSFNFALDNLSSGAHKIEVQARLSSGSSAQLGAADAKATLGKGSVVIEEVRFNQGDVIDLQ